MKTIDIFKAVLSKKYAIEILKLLKEEDRTFTGLKEHTSAKHNPQIDRVLKFLARFALVSHIIQKAGPKEVSFYRINQRGKDILELYGMMEDNEKADVEISLPAR